MAQPCNFQGLSCRAGLQAAPQTSLQHWLMRAARPLLPQMLPLPPRMLAWLPEWCKRLRKPPLSPPQWPRQAEKQSPEAGLLHLWLCSGACTSDAQAVDVSLAQAWCMISTDSRVSSDAEMVTRCILTCSQAYELMGSFHAVSMLRRCRH